MSNEERALESNEGPFELENQFIMRLPAGPAASLRAVVAAGVLSLKDRLTIQMEADIKRGTVRFDGWTLPFKIVDLPAVIESLKTLDGKTFYKTADICQMMICKEEVDDEHEEENKRKEHLKDGKIIWPHGITPSLKNVRKKRFRKTLKKKLVDAPEIEKEVRRLFRTDNEAISVRYEVVNAEEEKADARASNASNSANVQVVAGGNQISTNNNTTTSQTSMDIVEHDLFGEVLSSSDEDDTRAQDSDDERSRLSLNNAGETTKDECSYVTEFTPGILNENMEFSESSKAAAAAVAALEDAAASGSISDSGNATKLNKLNQLGEEIEKLQARRRAQELEIASIENLALKQRFQSVINNLKEEEDDKQRQYDEILISLNA